MNTLLTPGQSKPLDLRAADGALVMTVQVDRHHEGVSITAVHHPALNRTFTNDQLPEGRQYLQFLYDEARKGTALWAIEAHAGVLTSTSAIVNQAEKAMVDGIRANMDATQPKPVDVSDIVPQGAGSWQALRRSHTRKANVTTDAMDRILASADAGYIARSGQATSRQLIALKDRGLVELDWQWIGRERSIAGAWLAGHKPQDVAA
jgi:hypothetical protein